jgi:prepilin-type N-terminal cleavage/methylation domain-containing protein
MKFKKGFTLIELLVVIAIIGILSSIVLASLNQARGKGANAAVKSNLANIRASAELYYDNQPVNTYVGMCSTNPISSALTAADSAGGGLNKCLPDLDSWVISTELKQPEGTSVNWCVDSNGASKGITAAQDTAITTANTPCP